MVKRAKKTTRSTSTGDRTLTRKQILAGFGGKAAQKRARQRGKS